MGNKKKRNHPDLEELLQRPWCYYCERDFDDLKILIDHQRAKHFKCERCGRRLNTAGGLQVHMNQVHKETLSSIENALPNRSGLEVEIFGTEGIPADISEQHRQRVLTQYAQAEADRRAATGNPPPGGATGSEGAAKKVKTESLEEIKKRKAEFKAKKAAEAAAAAQEQVNSPATSTPGESAAPHQPLQTDAGPQTSYGSLPHSYGSVQSPGFAPGHPSQHFNPHGNPGYGGPHHQPPLAYGGSPVPYAQHFGNGPPGPFVPGRMPPFGATSPPVPYGQGVGFPPPAQNSLPAPIPAIPGPLNGYNGPSGLPQRPAFGAPPVNAATMHQMHQGQMPSHVQVVSPAGNEYAIQPSESNGSKRETPGPDAKQSTPAPAAKDETTAGKKSKKIDKTIRLVYADDQISPEEKMSLISRYAYTRDGRPQEVTQSADAEMIGALNAPVGVSD